MGTLKTLLAAPAATLIFVAALTSIVNESVDGPSGVTLGAVVTIAAGAFWAALGAAQSERQLRAKSDEIAATVSGGDSFCFVSPMFPARPGLPGHLMIRVEGKYPMYDISLRVVDVDKFDEIMESVGHSPSSLEDVAPAESYVAIGNLSPGGAAFIRQVIVPHDKNIRWNVFISSRNGLFIQTLRMLRLGDGRWTSAMKVVREEPPEDVLLKQEINADYPRDSGGNVVW